MAMAMAVAAAVSKLDELLLTELECPVCLEFMLPPITLCENGHNICNSCKPNLQTCPTCRGNLMAIRCMTLEKMVEDLHYPCIYHKQGCEESFPSYLIAGHQALCQFSPYNCPSEGCDWKGASSDLFMHIEHDHSELVKIFFGSDMMAISDYDILKEYKEIIVSGDQVFISTVGVVGSVWRFVLQCVGSKEVAAMYEYTVSFSNKREKGCINVTHLSQSVREDLDDVYKSYTCVMLPVEVVQSFMLEEDLVFYLEIKQYGRNDQGPISSKLSLSLSV